MALDPTTQIFATQDDTGTVALVFVENDSPRQTWHVGSEGTITGVPMSTAGKRKDGGFDQTVLALRFRVAQFRTDGLAFNSVTPALNAMVISALLNDGSVTPNADWPGMSSEVSLDANSGASPLDVLSLYRANAYIDVDYLTSYLAARGIDVFTLIPASPTTGAFVKMQAAIVRATDYIDQKYRFAGVKLLQRVGPSTMDANSSFVESWLTPYALSTVSYLTPSTSLQTTQWPRQGAIDDNGDTVNGIPEAVKQACAELAWRVLGGVNLQPDYDKGLVGNGGVVSSITKKVGPLETVTSYDTKFGLGFFASFPIVDRIGHSYFPTVGYRGGLRLLEKILDALLDRQDRDAPEESFELVM